LLDVLTDCWAVELERSARVPEEVKEDDDEEDAGQSER
jgi:hypothetical protein